MPPEAQKSKQKGDACCCGISITTSLISQGFQKPSVISGTDHSALLESWCFPERLTGSAPEKWGGVQEMSSEPAHGNSKTWGSSQPARSSKEESYTFGILF